ncbi:MAG: AMP-binding protein [Lentimicrobium sp.]|jgi:acyl-coenzyme A synthetase/AMP-(fatty) acid ligase|nr:AMP-binding protein [Lentimicrobium sp.]
MELFYADISSGVKIKWGDLLADLKHMNRFTPYCQESDFYLVFLHLIASMLLEREIVLFDSDFSQDETERLLRDFDFTNNTTVIGNQFAGIATKDVLLERLKQVGPSWRITLFTSGTTGLPKHVSHSYKSVTRFVKTSARHSFNTWGYAYNPTHMAGIQVFFQALLNGNPIIRLFGLSKDQIFQSISYFSISHISATPTFYRLLLPTNNHFQKVTNITSGGEKFDDKLSAQLTRAFPNAKITNVYASTEAGTLLASKGNEFLIKEEYADTIKIENGELLVHKSLMGTSDNINSDWYHTGDLVEIVAENPLLFKFLSRKNEMINVGGYKVNPTEVEETIRDIQGVADVRVFARNSSVLGNIICCEVVRSNPSLDESCLRKQLQTRLQEFKIPRMVRFVDILTTTRTGKLKRN